MSFLSTLSSPTKTTPQVGSGGSTFLSSLSFSTQSSNPPATKPLSQPTASPFSTGLPKPANTGFNFGLSTPQLARGGQTIKGSAEGGASQVYQGVNQIVQGVQDYSPLKIGEGLLNTGAGGINAISSFLAPYFSLLQPGTDYAANKISNTKPFQEYGLGSADVPASQQTVPERVAQAVENSTVIAGVLAGELKLNDPGVVQAVAADIEKQPVLKQAFQQHTDAVAATNDLAKTIQAKVPALQAARVYDIAERAQSVPPEQVNDFVKGELAKIDQNSLPTYPQEPVRATAADTTPLLAKNELAASESPAPKADTSAAFDGGVPKELEPLAAEARKASTPEQFRRVMEQRASERGTDFEKAQNAFIQEVRKSTNVGRFKTENNISSFEDFYNRVKEGTAIGEPSPIQPKPLDVTPGVSKIGKSIEAKAVEAKLTTGFDKVAGYDPITIKDQADKAAALVNDNIDTARAVIRGDKPLPDGLRGTALVTAMEEHIKANPNPEMAYELANSPLVSESSAAAQEMRLMAEREPDSATAKIQEIKRNLLQSSNRTPKQRAARARSAVDATEKINLSPKEIASLDHFLAEIAC